MHGKFEEFSVWISVWHVRTVRARERVYLCLRECVFARVCASIKFILSDFCWYDALGSSAHYVYGNFVCREICAQAFGYVVYIPENKMLFRWIAGNRYIEREEERKIEKELTKSIFVARQTAYIKPFGKNTVCTLFSYVRPTLRFYFKLLGALNIINRNDQFSVLLEIDKCFTVFAYAIQYKQTPAPYSVLLCMHRLYSVHCAINWALFAWCRTSENPARSSNEKRKNENKKNAPKSFVWNITTNNIGWQSQPPNFYYRCTNTHMWRTKKDVRLKEKMLQMYTFHIYLNSPNRYNTYYIDVYLVY